MSIAFGIGLVVGLAVVLVTVVLLKKKCGKKSEYDERQVAARGRAFPVEMTLNWLSSVGSMPESSIRESS